MKKYSYTKAKTLIKKHKDNLLEASLGMHEDWFWTAVTIWKDGKYIQVLKRGVKLAGIDGSAWATPTIELRFKDGTIKMIEVSTGNKTETSDFGFADYLGSLSGPVQENITLITKE